MEDNSIDQEIRRAQARVSELSVERDALREKNEAGERRAARLSHYYEQERKLEREIASLKGQPYRDESDPDYEFPQPPDDMPET